MMGSHDDPGRIRAVIALRASCESALRQFDATDLEDLGMSVRLTELRDLLDEYLAEAGRRLADPDDGLAAS